MAWEGSSRRARLPANWAKLRERVFQEAGYRCEWTERYSDGEVERCIQPAEECDHIRRGDDHSRRNLRALCHAHHSMKSGWEGNQASGQRFLPKRRTAERNLGEL